MSRLYVGLTPTRTACGRGRESMYRAISRWRSVRAPRHVALSRRVSTYVLWLCVFALTSSVANAQAPLPRPTQEAAAKPDLMQGHPSPEQLQKFLAAHEELRAKHQRAARSASARGAIGRTTVVALCIDSFVVNGTHRASAEDVKIVSAAPRDCEGDRCRAYEVTATRDSTQPFDLEVSVTCT
jgi:hypothetical protein